MGSNCAIGIGRKEGEEVGSVGSIAACESMRVQHEYLRAPLDCGLDSTGLLDCQVVYVIRAGAVVRTVDGSKSKSKGREGGSEGGVYDVL